MTNPKNKSSQALLNPDGPGSQPISEHAHKMVQKEDGLDPHRRTGDRNMDIKSGHT